MRNFSSNRASSHEADQDIPLVPKQEILDFDFPSHSVLETDFGDNAASSSGSNVRSILTGMGFQLSHVNKMIEEKGEDDFDLLLDALVSYTEGPQISNPGSSDSLQDLFGDKVSRGPPEVSTRSHVKKEPDITDNFDDTKIASLLSMNFSLEEVNFAMDKLGKNAPIDGLVDFIVAAQIAKRLEQVAEDISDDDKEINKEINNDVLFGTMDKSLRLLEMGFSEIQVSWAIENCGAELPISELADSIITGRIPVKKSTATGSQCRPSSSGIHPVKPEFEGFHADTIPEEMGVNLDSVSLGKKPKQENAGDSSQTVPRPGIIERDEIRNGKRPKPEDDYVSDLFPEPNFFYEEEKFNPGFDRDRTPEPLNKRPRKPLTGLVAKPSYFLYGVVGDVSNESWAKARKFLYNLEPEFVNTHHFSALSRNEGYIHNLPTEERFEIDPKPPMTIEEAMPHTKKWWPVWDPRKRLDRINDEADGVSNLCDHLARLMNSSRGLLSAEQQRSVLNHCRSRNLVWVGRNRLAAIDPMNLEIILGYPANHTDGFSSLTERLQSLKHSFQPDTLGYHLSVLKSIFPGGLTLLSIFSGIGGTEIALHKLGVPLKAVVSVEPCETKRKILKKWWQSSRQAGELVQFEAIQKLTSSKLSSLVGEFGCFDLVVCQRPSSSSATQSGDRIFGFDFSLFCEFTRVLQRVRGMKDLRR